jgi:hypothetical protein
MVPGHRCTEHVDEQECHKNGVCETDAIQSMKQPAGIRNSTWHRWVKGSFEIGFVSGTRWVLGLLRCVWPGGVGHALTGDTRTTAEREAMHAFVRGRRCSKVPSLFAATLRSEAVTW